MVVGGGFSGTLLALQLLRRAPALSVAVVDKGAVPGRGLAYSTRYSCHLLNVPAGNMSALPEEPDHLLRWAQANHAPAVYATSFLPRLVYGKYIASLLETARHSSGGNLRWIHGEVASVRREQSRIDLQLADGSQLSAQSLVLALGNFPPANLNLPGLGGNSPRYVRSPWSPDALRDIPKNGNVLLIGSGLTSVDLAAALKSEGFTGHIHILSRRGLMPQVHRRTPEELRFWTEDTPTTIRGLLRRIRERVRAASESGGDWREVIDSLRPVTQQIWQSLPPAERKRFLRHVRSYWEVHRHRIAPEIGDTIAALVRQGQAILYAGRVANYREFPDRAEVDLRDRKTGVVRTLTVDRVINCTGPETDCRRIADPLIQNLLAQGLAQPDPLFLGLDVNRAGALIAAGGNASPDIYVIGPARKGSLWETIAVPELRAQASELAEHLARTLAPEIQPELEAVAIAASSPEEQGP